MSVAAYSINVIMVVVATSVIASVIAILASNGFSSSLATASSTVTNFAGRTTVAIFYLLDLGLKHQFGNVCILK